MTNNSVYLAIAPNILRKTVQDLSRLDLSLDLIPPQTHQEMLDFSIEFGLSDEVPGLTMCAYPQYIYNLLKLQERGKLAPLPETLPPMRKELTALGMAEPSRYFRVIGFVPFVIAASKNVEPPITDWKDLCRPDICNAIAVPPHDTPLPALFDTMMAANYGDQAAGAIAGKNTEYTPLDINKQIDSGEFAAGISIPAFSKTYRDNNGYMVWPTSGAWPVPLIATVRADATKDATHFLEYLLSNEYQTYLSQTGSIIPVVDGIPWFPEMAENEGRLQWPGWDAIISLGMPNDA